MLISPICNLSALPRIGQHEVVSNKAFSTGVRSKSSNEQSKTSR